MRVLYDYQICSLQAFGGVTRYYYELCSALSRLPDTEIEVFLGLHISTLDWKALSPAVQISGTRRPRLPGLGRLSLMANRAAIASRGRCRSYDIRHFTYYRERPTGRRYASVITVYDMIHERYPESFPGDDTARRKRLSLAGADAIIAISEATRNDLVELLGVKPERIQVIHLANYLKIPASPTAPHPHPYVLFVGERRWYKNFALLLDSMSRSKRLAQECDLVCFGGPSLEPGEADAASKAGVRLTRLVGDEHPQLCQVRGRCRPAAPRRAGRSGQRAA